MYKHLKHRKTEGATEMTAKGASMSSALTLVSSASDQASDEQTSPLLPEHHTLILANLRLVSYVARRYETRGIPLDDLVQEGMLGLIRAAQKYDAAKGAFSNWAFWWIRQAILSALLKQTSILHVPAWKIEV